MDNHQNGTVVTGSGSRSYEQIQDSLDNYVDLRSHPVAVVSGHVTESQNRGKTTMWRTVVLLGLLCTILLIVCIVLGSTRSSSQAGTCNLDLEKENTELKKNISILEKATEKIQHQWWYFASSIYFISLERKTWDESRHECNKKQGDLVVINSKEEQEFVKKLASSIGQNTWLGLTDRHSEGSWKWVDEKLMTTGYWNVGQPNNDDGTEDCVSVFSGGWHANPCHQQMHYICEFAIYCTSINSRPTYLCPS